MTETPQELIARLRGRARFCSDRGEIKSPSAMNEAADVLEASLAREAAETARCWRIITAGRNGDINGDFWSIMHFVNSGDQMSFVEAAGVYMHDSKRADYEAIAALEKEGGE